MLTIYNPMPKALLHYTKSTEYVLQQIGVEYDVAQASSIERGSHSLVSRSLRALRDRHRMQGRVLVLWPAFADLEPLTWLGARHAAEICVIVHDASPLRKSYGQGGIAARAGNLARRVGGVKYLVHSPHARSEMAARGWAVDAVVPHPFVERTLVGEIQSRNTVLVAGQYKAARDTSLLRQIGPLLDKEGLVGKIVGRGWPPIDGWTVKDSFVEEKELDQEIGRALLVFVPYSKLYQSGIAVRAAELGRPVVGPELSNIPEIFGSDWRGSVAASAGLYEWLEAIFSVAKMESEDGASRIGEWKVRTMASWKDLATQMSWG